MDEMEGIFRTICLAGAVQALLLFFVLAVKKNNRRANRYLSVYMFFMALNAFELYLGPPGYADTVVPYRISVVPYSYIFGPSVFLYISHLTGSSAPLMKKILVLYVSVPIILAVNIGQYFFFDSMKISSSAGYLNFIINGGGLIYEGGLYAGALVMIQRFIKKQKDYYSSIDAFKLSLLRIVLIFLIISVVFIFNSLIRGNHGRHWNDIPDLVGIIIGLGLGFGIALTAMIQPELFNRVEVMIESPVRNDKNDTVPKYNKLRLSTIREEQYVEDLKKYMGDNKPHLQDDLTLKDLAEALSMTPHHLSMILNIHFKQNFYNFVNSYRVDEVKESLKNPDDGNRNILSIAYSAGFNSKSTFNTIFKKVTGKTPKEYRADPT